MLKASVEIDARVYVPKSSIGLSVLVGRNAEVMFAEAVLMLLVRADDGEAAGGELLYQAQIPFNPLRVEV